MDSRGGVWVARLGVRRSMVLGLVVAVVVAGMTPVEAAPRAAGPGGSHGSSGGHGAAGRVAMARRAAAKLPDAGPVVVRRAAQVKKCSSRWRGRVSVAWCGAGIRSGVRQIHTPNGGRGCVATEQLLAGSAGRCVIKPGKHHSIGKTSQSGMAKRTATTRLVPDTGWSVDLSYSGTSTLKFTATVNQPLDNTGKWLEIFELTKSGSTQYLNYCNRGSTCTASGVVPHAAVGRYVAVVGSTITNTYAQYSDTKKLAESAVVSPPPWSLSMTASVGSTVHFTATSNYLPSAAGAYIEVFEKGRNTTTTYLGYTQTGSLSVSGVPHAHRASFIGVVGSNLANTYPEYPDSAKFAESATITPPPWTVSLQASASGVTAVTNYDVGAAGAWIEIFDLSSTQPQTYLGWCSTGTVCTKSGGAGPYLATAGGISDTPVPSPLYAESNVAGVGPTNPSELFGGSNPSMDTDCLSCQGDPVNTATGEFFTAATDLAVAGRGPALVVDRTYSSARASVDGPFGLGWASLLGMRLSQDTATGTVSVVQENGSSIAFTANADGSYAAPSRVLASLTHAADGSWTLTRRHRAMFGFGADGRLLTVSDLNGDRVRVSYGPDGLPDAMTSDSGRSISFTSTGGHITTATDPSGAEVDYGYDDTGHLVSVTDPTGAATGYSYDDLDRLTSVTDPLGHTTTNGYDNAGRVTSQTDPAGGVTGFGYGTDGATTVTSPAGRVTRDVYTNGVLTAQTVGYGSPAAGTTSYQYDPDLLSLASVTDPDGHTSTIESDAAGNTTSVSNPLGETTSSVYDQLNDPTTITGPLGHAAVATYDADGNLTGITRTLGDQDATTSFDRSTSHPADVLGVTDPTGNTTGFTYTAAGDLATRTDPAGHTTSYAYDPDGRLTTSTDPAGHDSSQAYDPDGRPTSITDPNGHTTSITYTADGQIATVTDPANHTTSYDYNSRGLLTTTTDPDGHATSYAYDADGLLTSVTDPGGNTTSYGYDAAGNLTSRTDPLTRSTGYQHDPAGLLTALTDPDGRVTSYSYNAANRLTGIDYSDPATPDASLVYDKAGDLTSRTDAAGASSYRYDSLGRVTQTGNGNGQQIDYTYDLAGRLTGLTYPNGHQVTRTYNTDGLLAGVTDWLAHTTSFSYNTTDRRIGVDYPGGVHQTDSYDPAGNLTGITVTNPGGPVTTANYTRNSRDQLTSAAGSSVEHDYAYTALAQLASDTSTVGTSSYGYDTVGNRTSLPDPAGGQASIGYDAAAQPTSYTPANTDPLPLAYNTEGARISGPALEPAGDLATVDYTYDQASRLTTITPRDGPVTSYIHDASGLTSSESTGTTTRQFAWSANAVPDLLTDGTTSYLYDDAGSPIEQIGADGQPLFFQHDQYGSTTTLTGADGTVQGRYHYTPDGVTDSHTGADTALQWAGQYHDSATGWYDLRARYYDPITAQFTTRDPLQDATGAPYSYANNDPLNQTDPTGLCPECIGAIVGFAFFGGLDLASQVIYNRTHGCPAFHNIDYTEVAIAGTLGALAGASFGAGLGLAAESELAAADQSALDYATTSSKLDHIFAAKHNLDPLVQQYGSRESVVQQLLGGLEGLTPESGTFEQQIVVGGQKVVVRGAVVDGVTKIGTAFTP